MKLYRFLRAGSPRLAVMHQGMLIELASLLQAAKQAVPPCVASGDMRGLLEQSGELFPRVEQALAKYSAPVAPDNELTFSIADAELLAPVADPGKIICVGLNYRDHCEEQNKPIPVSPVIFAKFANTVSAPGAIVSHPAITKAMDYEGELGIVIGQRASKLEPSQALDAVAGYTIVNDLTARDLQKTDGQWLRAKSIDGFAPMGPCIVTKAEIPNPAALEIETRVNGEVRQKSHTANMVFDVPFLVSFISQAITLHPGDIISTGTPGGVGAYFNPPKFLKPGDEIAITISGIGVLHTRIG